MKKGRKFVCNADLMSGQVARHDIAALSNDILAGAFGGASVRNARRSPIETTTAPSDQYLAMIGPPQR